MFAGVSSAPLPADAEALVVHRLGLVDLRSGLRVARSWSVRVREVARARLQMLVPSAPAPLLQQLCAAQRPLAMWRGHLERTETVACTHSVVACACLRSSPKPLCVVLDVYEASVVVGDTTTRTRTPGRVLCAAVDGGDLYVACTRPEGRSQILHFAPGEPSPFRVVLRSTDDTIHTLVPVAGRIVFATSSSVGSLALGGGEVPHMLETAAPVRFVVLSPRGAVGCLFSDNRIGWADPACPEARAPGPVLSAATRDGVGYAFGYMDGRVSVHTERGEAWGRGYNAALCMAMSSACVACVSHDGVCLRSLDATPIASLDHDDLPGMVGLADDGLCVASAAARRLHVWRPRLRMLKRDGS